MIFEPYPAIQIVHEFMNWFGDVVSTQRDVGLSDIEQYFHHDAVTTVNGVEKCRGLEAHVAHFGGLAAQMTSVKIVPFTFFVGDDGQAVGYYRTSFTVANVGAGTSLNMAIWKIRAGRIAETTKVIHYEALSS